MILFGKHPLNKNFELCETSPQTSENGEQHPPGPQTLDAWFIMYLHLQ